MEIIGESYNGSEILRRWFDPNMPTLSIFEKRKPQVAKKIPDDVREMVEGWIGEGEEQRHERMSKNKKRSLVYSSSTT